MDTSTRDCNNYHEIATTSIGWIKCNYNGSYNTVTRQSKAGWILKNERGVFIDAGQAIGIMTTSPLDSELQALLIAMQHSWCKGFRKIIFEGDCKSISEILNGKTLNFGCYNWIKEINYWKTRFEEVDFTWTPRQNNRPADLLAKFFLPDNSSYNVYSCILTFLLHDLRCNNY
ncbi:PREDICTED: uncharacterized protein LOC109127242 [Camelina sativa]|uniref:Uncharacterized protein LOC109127242 n=1 Tax=Camelina sativa TaxID=90675 RepID=A0ABM1QKP6_CAMSA|nr:PREDICTED: uncharacterized protein LOC109127242 [Camelina sativa]